MPVYDTIIGDAYVFDYDSIISIDSTFGPHNEFLGMDTTYLCTDTLIDADTTIIHIEGFHNYRAICADGWRLDKWELIIPYPVNDTIVIIDTLYSYTDILGDDFTDDEWMDWPGVPDTIFNPLGIGIKIIAYFTQDTTPVGIGEVIPQSYHVYPNPTTGTISVLGDVYWIVVYDMSGRIMMETNKPTIDLRSQPNGTYLVRVVDTKGNMGIIKVIKR